MRNKEYEKVGEDHVEGAFLHQTHDPTFRDAIEKPKP